MKMHFNYKDLFKAPRIAFSFQRIWVNGIGLLGGYLFYLVLTYLSFLISGYNFSPMWARFGLLPCGFAVGLPWYGLLVYLIGVAGLIAVILLTNTAVSRVVYMVLRDEIFYTWTQAYKFAFKKWVSVLGSMLTFIFMIAFFVIGALIMGLLGRIPWIGELGTFFLTIPYMLAALLLLFIGIVFVVGIFLVPAVIATSDEDALGGVFQSFSITFNQPWRLVIYGVIAAVLEVLGIIVLAFALKISYLIFAGLFSVGMGTKFVNITEHGFYLIDRALPALYDWMQYLFGSNASLLYLSHHHAALSLPGVQVVAAYLFTIFMILIGGAVLAYGEAVGNAGGTILYVVLYKMHEDENLLEREDAELKEEEEEISSEVTTTSESEQAVSETEEKQKDETKEEKKDD